MQRSSILITYLSLFFFLSACKTTYQPAAVQYLDYRITPKQTTNSSLDSLLKPYADSVNKTMNDVVAIAGMNLEKKQPEGTLNNVLADAMLFVAKEKYNTAIDASFVNYGGIRLNTIAAGNVTRGKIFEVAPFDNIIVLLKMKGELLQQFLDHIATRGGWPCAGVAFQIKNKRANNVLIGGMAIESNKEYTIALLDYVANGGDDCVMLKDIPQQNNGYLLRDAVINYFSKFQQEGKKIMSQIENRVTNAD
ncbi:MAG: 5'-nucleotidase C-terminal domain-containing protein [Ferruginibacter sp.]